MLIDRRNKLRQTAKTLPDNVLFVRPGTYLNSVSGRVKGKHFVAFYEDFFDAFSAGVDLIRLYGAGGCKANRLN